MSDAELVPDRPSNPSTHRSPALRVFLADDHEVVRRGTRGLIEGEDDLVVVGEASSVAEALARIPAARPDVAVLDLQLGDASGLDVCRALRHRSPEIRCLMFSASLEDDAILASVTAGAAGYVVKRAGGGELLDSIRHVVRVGTMFDPATIQRARDADALARADEPVLASLSTREAELLGLLARGMSNREIAQALYLAENTVKNRVTMLLAKVGATTRTEAAVWATRLAERRQRWSDEERASEAG